MRPTYFLLISLFSFPSPGCHASLPEQHDTLLTETEAFISFVEQKIKTDPSIEAAGDQAVHGLAEGQPELFAWKQECGPKSILHRHVGGLSQHPAETLEAPNPLRLVQRWTDGTGDKEIIERFGKIQRTLNRLYVAMQSDPNIQAGRQHQQQRNLLLAEQKLMEVKQTATAAIAESEDHRNAALSAQQALITNLAAAEKARNDQLLEYEQQHTAQRLLTAQAEHAAYTAKKQAGEAEERVAYTLLEGEKVKSARAENSEKHQRRLPFLIAGSSIVVLFTYFLGKHYLNRRPTIIERTDTSLLAWWEKLLGYKVPASNLDNVILEPILVHQVLDKLSGLTFAIQEGYPLSNMLFCGEPGTGKTMTAQAFARKLSEQKIADHIIIRGAAFKRLDSPAKAQAALAQILRLAYANRLPFILVFDEAETLFPDRNSIFANEMTNDLTTTILSFFENAISGHVMFILLTNYPERLDAALLNRIDPSNYLYFTKPGKEERLSLLSLYLQEHISNRSLMISDEILNQKEQLAESLDGFVGRQINSLVAQTLYTMARYQTKQLELFMLKEAIAIAQKNNFLVSK